MISCCSLSILHAIPDNNWCQIQWCPLEYHILVIKRPGRYVMHISGKDLDCVCDVMICHNQHYLDLLPHGSVDTARGARDAWRVIV